MLQEMCLQSLAVYPSQHLLPSSTTEEVFARSLGMSAGTAQCVHASTSPSVSTDWLLCGVRVCQIYERMSDLQAAWDTVVGSGAGPLRGPQDAMEDGWRVAGDASYNPCYRQEAMGVPSGEGADTWAPLLARVAPDRRAFRTDLLAEHKKAVRVGALGGVAFLALAAAVMGFTLKALALKLVRGIQLASDIEPTRLVAGLVVGLLIARAV